MDIPNKEQRKDHQELFNSSTISQSINYPENDTQTPTVYRNGDTSGFISTNLDNEDFINF